MLSCLPLKLPTKVSDFMKKALQTAALIMVLTSCQTHADISSQIIISTFASQTVTGLYFQALAAGTCPGTPVFSPSANSNFGTMWTGGVALNNQSIAIGANYLYEMVNIAIYEGYHAEDGTISAGITPGSNIWCINLGIAGGAPVVATSSVTTSLLPFVNSTSISITCNDSTKNCLTSSGTPVRQNF